MPHIPAKLPYQLFVYLFQIVVFVILFTRPFRQFGQDPLQVPDAIFTGLHIVVAQVFRLGPGVLVESFATEPQPGVRLKAIDDPAVDDLRIFLGIFGAGIGIPPLDGPTIILTDTGKEIFFRDTVFRLRNVVEPCIVHDGRSMPVNIQPGPVAELFHRHCTAAAHIVTQPERMAHFM